MAKRPSISTISSGYASTTTLNDNFEALQEAFDNTISRDGSTPNTMSADLDMNGNDIIGASSVLVGGVDYLAQSLAYKNAAETSKIAAEAAKVAAELAYDNFDDRYLGVKTSDPSTDNDGNALLDGALFFDTTLNVLKVYDQGNTVWKRTTPTTAEQANIDTVTGISSDVTTVAGNNANVTTVADNITDVNSVATNMAEVLTADTNAATATTKAAEASASATAAANSATSASTSATTASNQATAAATSASNAATSESNASTSASNAASSATSASGSAATATTQASNAASSASAASTSETNAANSATASATSASNSATSESNAATSASNAATSASNAATSASNASTSESNAATSATAAAASYDSFDDRYLGVKATAPSTDNDGDALTTGCLYYNSTVGQLYIWDGSAWDDAALSASGAVTSFNTRTGSVTLNSTDVLNASGLLNTGGTMTGALVLNADPSVALGAATKQYVDNEVAGIVDTAPATLDTLNELAAALGDDPNFATTVTNSIATKLPLAGGTLTGALDVTGTVTADGLTVDGASPAVATLNSTSNGVRVEFNGASTPASRPWEVGVLNNADGDFQIYQAADAGAGDIKFYTDGALRQNIDAQTGDISFYEDTGTTPKFFWDASAERLGLGTTTPATSIQVVESGGTPEIRLADGTHAAGLGVDTVPFVGAISNTSFAIKTNNTERMRIDSSGRVKIGTTSNTPASAGTAGIVFGDNTAGTPATGVASFAADGSAPLLLTRLTSDGNVLGIADATTTRGLLRVVSGNFAIQGNNNLVFSTGGSNTERMRLDGSGNLLVGKTSTSSTTAGGNIFGGLGSFVRDGNTPLSLNRRTNQGELVSFAAQDSVVGSIGAVNGDMYQGTGAVGFRYNDGGVNIIPVNPASTGASRDNAIDLGASYARFKDGYFSGTVNAANFNTTSDQTLKTNVETLSGSLDAVKSLRGVSFDWLENGGSEIGVIAQEVEAVLPDVVSTNDEGIKSVKYGNMVAVLIEAIKEQQLRIEALEAKLGE